MRENIITAVLTAFTTYHSGSCVVTKMSWGERMLWKCQIREIVTHVSCVNCLSRIDQPGIGWLPFNERNRNPQPFRRVSICNFARQKLSFFNCLKNRMTFVESSPKAGWLSLKVLWKQDDFRWKLYESKMTFVESSTKAGSGWLSLKAPRKVYKSRMTFVESFTKVGSGRLLLKALRKQDDFRWKLCESRIRMTFVESSAKAGSG